MSTFIQHLLCVLLLVAVFPLVCFSPEWTTDVRISSRNVHLSPFGVRLAEASSSTGHVVVQYDLGETRVLNCPYSARTLEGDCHPAAYRRALFLASGLPNVLLSAFTVIGGVLYAACGGCRGRRPSTRWKRKHQTRTRVMSRRSKEKENPPIIRVDPDTSGLLESAKERDDVDGHHKEGQEVCFPPPSSPTTEWDVPVAEVNRQMKKKKKKKSSSRDHHHRRSGHKKDAFLLGGRTYPLGPRPPLLPSSTALGAVCEIYCFPWFLSLVVFLCTLVAFCVAMGNLRTLLDQMTFLSSHVHQAEDALVQLGDQLDFALRHVQIDTRSDANGVRTPFCVSLLSSSSSSSFTCIQEEKEISSRLRDPVERPPAFSSAPRSPQERWSTELFPHVRDQLARLHSHSMDSVIRTVQNPYFLSAWTYGLFSMLLLLSSGLFLTFMRWWNQLAALRVFVFLFVAFSALMWIWVGYHSMVSQFLSDSCAEVQYYAAQHTNVLAVVTTCATPRSVYAQTSFFSSSSPDSFSSLWAKNGEPAAGVVPSTSAAGTSEASTSSSSILRSAAPSMTMTSPAAASDETLSGALYFEALYQSYLDMVIPFACNDTTRGGTNGTASGIERAMGVSEKAQGEEASVGDRVSRLSSCRTALQQRWVSAAANASASPSEEAQRVADALGHRVLALDDLLSNLTVASAVTSCEGILAVAVPPLVSGCHQAVFAYQSLVQHGGGLMGLMGTLGACTAAIGAKRLLRLRRAHSE